MKVQWQVTYASDLTDIIVDSPAMLWVHGHMHDSSDYVLGKTRFISNPRGYEDENPHFDLRFTVEI